PLEYAIGCTREHIPDVPVRHGASINNAASGMLLLPLAESLTAREMRNLGLPSDAISMLRALGAR
ncbi:MAG: hypothetical protein CMQ29_09610, partial [Gammaproteobacteria bacterium]|nr:hypothetical protein [Gammaproteobacteria bacterium]